MNEVKAEAQHPEAHVPLESRYERMLEQCASLNATRQAREDGLVATVTQISSAALLAVPGFLVGAGKASNLWNWELEVGLIAFGIALLSAMAEQHLSAKAHAKHIDVVQKYYLLESTKREDKRSRAQVRMARQIAFGSFLLAVVLTSVSLVRLGV